PPAGPAARRRGERRSGGKGIRGLFLLTRGLRGDGRGGEETLRRPPRRQVGNPALFDRWERAALDAVLLHEAVERRSVDARHPCRLAQVASRAVDEHKEIATLEVRDQPVPRDIVR